MGREASLSEEGGGTTRRRRRSAQPEPTRDTEFLDVADDRDERSDVMQGPGDAADEERFAAFLGQIESKVLPDLPGDPSFHICWCSTTSKHDTIPKRMQMGYEPVTPDMVPGWNAGALDMYLQSTTYPGVISLNEMIAMRIPMRLYQRYMKHLHHKLPIAEEEKVRAKNKEAASQAEEAGGRLLETPDMANFVQRAREPTFAG